LLEASIESLVLSEDTLPKLTSENEELQRRVRKLTSQLEETERRLENESSSRRRLEDSTDARIQEVEANWTKVLEEKQNNWEVKEKYFEEKIENQDRLLKEIKAGYEVTQRLNQADDEASEAAQNRLNTAELEMMSADLEKTSARLADIETRNEQLRLELVKASSLSRQGPSEEGLHEDPAYIRLQMENSSLLRKIDTLQFDKGSIVREWEEKYRQLDRQRALLDSANSELRFKVERCSDYDDMRRELDMLRSIELSTGDDDDDPEVDSSLSSVSKVNGASRGPNEEKTQSLEQLLLIRNKKLSSELTVLRVSYQELQQQLDSLQEEFQRTNADLEASQKLSSTLENDLLRLQEKSSNALPSSAMSVAGTYTSRYPQSSRRGRSSPTSSIISGYETLPRGSSAILEDLRSGNPVGGGSGILPMIQAQRDRFKQKNSQLEEELSKTLATVTALRQEVASLQKDNLGLYEKSRYVSTYNRGPNTTSSSAFSQEPSHTSIQISPDSSSGLQIDRYRSRYEAKISPFAAFRGRESARAYKRMTVPERIIFSVTRMVLATRTSRNLFAAYCLALHLLIFFMLYWSGTTAAEKHTTHLGEAVSIGLASALKGGGEDRES
jgi:homeobox protein cut-like